MIMCNMPKDARVVKNTVQRAPTQQLHPILKPWPSRGWVVDLIGKIYLLSLK